MGARDLNGIYTQAFNRRHGRVDHVLQGRYKAVLVDKDNYLLELARYVVLNPARAGMVATAGEWPWSSSYRAVMGKAAAPDWLAVDDTLRLFHVERGAACRAYARFVAEGVQAPDPIAAIERGGPPPCASGAWSAQHRARSRRPRRGDPRRIRNRGCTLQKIEERFGLHCSAVSQIVWAAGPGRAKNKT